MNNCGVYSVTNVRTGKRYIGSSVDVVKRWAKHRHQLNTGCHHSPKLQMAWAKYGSECFDFGIVLICEPKDVLMYEQACMDFYDSMAHGYNILPTAGSHFGVKRSQITKDRLSESAKRAMTPERRASMSVAAKAAMTDEKRAAISRSQKGRIKTPETMKKLSDACKGRVISLEQRAKMSASHKLVWAARRALKEESL